MDGKQTKPERHRARAARVLAMGLVLLVVHSFVLGTLVLLDPHGWDADAALSVLGAPGAWSAMWFNGAALPLGALALVMLGAGWGAYLRTRAGVGAGLTLAAAGLCIGLLALAPWPEPDHLWIAFVAYALAGLAILLLVFQLGGGWLRWPFRALTWALCTTSLVAPLLVGYGVPFGGWVQRAVHAVLVLWLTLVGVGMTRDARRRVVVRVRSVRHAR